MIVAAFPLLLKSLYCTDVCIGNTCDVQGNLDNINGADIKDGNLNIQFKGPLEPKLDLSKLKGFTGTLKITSDTSTSILKFLNNNEGSELSNFRITGIRVGGSYEAKSYPIIYTKNAVIENSPVVSMINRISIHCSGRIQTDTVSLNYGYEAPIVQVTKDNGAPSLSYNTAKIDTLEMGMLFSKLVVRKGLIEAKGVNYVNFTSIKNLKLEMHSTYHTLNVHFEDSRLDNLIIKTTSEGTLELSSNKLSYDNRQLVSFDTSSTVKWVQIQADGNFEIDTQNWEVNFRSSYNSLTISDKLIFGEKYISTKLICSNSLTINALSLMRIYSNSTKPYPPLKIFASETESQVILEKSFIQTEVAQTNKVSVTIRNDHSNMYYRGARADEVQKSWLDVKYQNGKKALPNGFKVCFAQASLASNCTKGYELVTDAKKYYPPHLRDGEEYHFEFIEGEHNPYWNRFDSGFAAKFEGKGNPILYYYVVSPIFSRFEITGFNIHSLRSSGLPTISAETISFHGNTVLNASAFTLNCTNLVGDTEIFKTNVSGKSVEITDGTMPSEISYFNAESLTVGSLFDSIEYTSTGVVAKAGENIYNLNGVKYVKLESEKDFTISYAPIQSRVSLEDLTAGIDVTVPRGYKLTATGDFSAKNAPKIAVSSKGAEGALKLDIDPSATVTINPIADAVLPLDLDVGTLGALGEISADRFSITSLDVNTEATIIVDEKANGITFKSGSNTFSSALAIGEIRVSGKATLDIKKGIKDPSTVAQINVVGNGNVALTEEFCKFEAPKDWKVTIEAEKDGTVSTPDNVPKPPFVDYEENNEGGSSNDNSSNGSSDNPSDGSSENTGNNDNNNGDNNGNKGEPKPGGLSGGGVAGIVIAVLVVVAVLVALFLTPIGTKLGLPTFGPFAGKEPHEVKNGVSEDDSNSEENEV